MQFRLGYKLDSHGLLLEIGEGGMGEVYMARDITLKHDVALSVLPATFLPGTGCAPRSEREAEVSPNLKESSG